MLLFKSCWTATCSGLSLGMRSLLVAIVFSYQGVAVADEVSVETKAKAQMTLA